MRVFENAAAGVKRSGDPRLLPVFVVVVTLFTIVWDFALVHSFDCLKRCSVAEAHSPVIIMHQHVNTTPSALRRLRVLAPFHHRTDSHIAT